MEITPNLQEKCLPNSAMLPNTLLMSTLWKTPECFLYNMGESPTITEGICYKELRMQEKKPMIIFHIPLEGKVAEAKLGSLPEMHFSMHVSQSGIGHIWSSHPNSLFSGLFGTEYGSRIFDITYAVSMTETADASRPYSNDHLDWYSCESNSKYQAAFVEMRNECVPALKPKETSHTCQTWPQRT